jgi:hypothetical protein
VRSSFWMQMLVRLLPNNGIQQTALRAAADAER